MDKNKTIEMKMKCIEAMSEGNSIENVSELRDKSHEKEITVSCKLLDKNSVDSSNQSNDPALSHEQEQAMISDSRSTKGYGFRKVSSCHSWHNVFCLSLENISDCKSTYQYMCISKTGL